MMNRKYLLLVWLLAISVNFVSAKPKDKPGDGTYRKEMTSLQTAIQKYFYDSAAGYYTQVASPEKGKHPYSFLWPICAMFQAVNEIEKVEPTANLVKPMLTILADYRDATPPTSGYAEYLWKFRPETRKNTDDTCRYYDDNQWIGITALDAYATAKKVDKPTFLNLGKETYDFMMSGYDQVSGGGIYWVETSKNSKNTCSNGPGIIVALKLYQATKDKKYLDTALRIYNWTNQKLKAPSGLYYDNISMKGGRIGKGLLSYNTGTMLQSNVYLYECTGDKKYLKEATAIADSAHVFFYGRNKFRDGYWFNAVLLRGYQHLLKYNKDTKYIIGFKKCLDNTLQTEKNESGLFAAKGKTFDLVEHGGLLEILARYAWLETKYDLTGS
jgi:mannose/cellobiose epimerase-like protein (N-acyl-D-glucosamine 2-epimerase family)